MALADIESVEGSIIGSPLILSGVFLSLNAALFVAGIPGTAVEP